MERTHYLENKFKEGDKWHEALKNVLLVYCMYRPDIGYTQGMNMMAALIYETVQDELQCFTMLANLIHRESIISDFLIMNIERIELQYQIFLHLVQKQMPEVH